MKRLLALSISLSIAGCGEVYDKDTERAQGTKVLKISESEAASACEIRLQQNLVAKDTFETRGMWIFSQTEHIATVQREYVSSNAFGTMVDSIYRCKYDGKSREITALSAIGPMGSKVIIEDAAAAHEAARLDRLQQGAARAIRNSGAPKPRADGEILWITNLHISGCPKAADWFEMQEAVQVGRWDVNLPNQCFEIAVGTKILMQTEGNRETATHNGHTYEKARLEGGKEFWTDSLDSLSLTPL